MKKSKDFSIILTTATAIVALIIIVIVVGLTRPDNSEIIQGEAETTDYRLSCKIPSRVLEIRVREGDHVSKGDTLAIMEAPDIKAKLMQAEAAYNAATAQSDKANKGSREEQLTQAYEVWQKAIAGASVAEKTYNRLERLFENGVIAEQKRDEAKAQYEAAKATEQAAKAQYDMAVNGTRREDKAAASAQKHRAMGAVDEVSSYVAETVVIASADGIVTEIFPEIGELVGAGAPIMNVECHDDVWLTFNVREDLLPDIKLGSETEVYIPAFDRNVRVKVTKIKDVGTFAAWKATKALDGFDLKTFEVEAHAINHNDMDGVRRGMSAIIRLDKQ